MQWKGCMQNSSKGKMGIYQSVCCYHKRFTSGNFKKGTGPMTKSSNKGIFLGLIVLISIIGGALAFYSSANGPWGYSDPVEYISTAFSILHGHGVGYYEGNAQFVFTAIHPPFYSVVLSLIGLTGINLVVAARWLNILLLVASIFIAGWVFLRFSRVPVLGVLASMIMATFPHMLEMFGSAYSEPLFVSLFLLGGLCLLVYQEKESTAFFFISAVTLGLIPFTRYSGIAMFLPGIVVVFALQAGKSLDRIKKVVLFTLTSCLPTILWLIWVYLVGNHNVGGRNVGVDLGQLGTQFQAFRGLFMDVVWKWIPFQNPVTKLSYSFRWILLVLGLLATLALSFLAGRKLQKDAGNGIPKSDALIFIYFGLSSLAYIAVLISTYLFTMPTIDVDNRMLLPLFVGTSMGLLGAFALWQTAWFTKNRRGLQVIPWLVGILCVYWYIPQARAIVEVIHQDAGLTAYHWNRSEMIQAVRALPADTPVISNDWELLLLWTQRPIHGLWVTFPTDLPIQETAYGTNPGDHTQISFCDEHAVLVIFNDFPTQIKNYFGDTAIDKIPSLFSSLSTNGSYPDGTIYICH
jgi:hypothetical protein